LAFDVPDISEELVLGRTLLEQGHLSTAQRVLVKLCQAHPENAEAFRGLGDVLHRKGDGARARIIHDYAQDLGTPIGAPEVRPAEQKARKPPPVPPSSQAEPPTPSAELITSIPSSELVEPMEEPAPVQAAPTMPPMAPSPASTMPTPSLPAAKVRSKKGWMVLSLVVLGLLAGAGVYGYRFLKPAPRRATFSPGEELDSALASGSLDRLMRIRDRARTALAGPSPDADALVRLALTDAYLALDFGVAAARQAEEALRRLPPADPTKPQRLVLVETVRSLLALDGGDRVAAQQHVDAGLAKAGLQPPPLLLFASARLRSLAGDLAAAGKDLDRAIAVAPDFAPVVADWALQRLSSGDAASARRGLKDFLAKNKVAPRVQLAEAEVERALGESTWKKRADLACHGDNRAARGLRAACLLASAQDARMDGERSTASRKARAAAQGSDDPRVLADSALVLALLGEIDAAEEILIRARKLADNTAAHLAWADLAIRLGRNQTAALPSSRPFLPEHSLLVLRAAYLKGGGPEMAAAVKDVPAGLTEIDADLLIYMELGTDGVPRIDRGTLEKRADHGNPVAAFVLGILAAREDDHKRAAKRLEKALAGHGDACRAALLYLSALQAQEPPGEPSRAPLQALRARNAACPIPEM
jgi:tetratricopeptide (TPR) repeat protein